MDNFHQASHVNPVVLSSRTAIRLRADLRRVLNVFNNNNKVRGQGQGLVRPRGSSTAKIFLENNNIA